MNAYAACGEVQALAGQLLLRLRGGEQKVCHARNLGKPGHWSGENIGPHARRIRQIHIRVKAETKVQSRWVFDCTLPAKDRLVDVTDFQRFLQENIKVQGKTGNLGARRGDDKPLVVVYVEAGVRVVVKSYTKISKRYVKYLAKQYLYRERARDFIWVVAAGKATYKLRYYNFDEVAKTAQAPSGTAAAGARAPPHLPPQCRALQVTRGHSVLVCLLS
jgi:large subunit ribosomal protein L22e